MSKKSNTSSRYYWIKLFEEIVNGDMYDYMMSLDNGPTIFTIYIALMMSVINKNGKFITTINNIEIVDTVDKIKKDLKHFKFEQIAFTLGFLEKFGLLGKDENGAYYFIDYDRYIGSESKAAIRKRRSRENIKLLETKRDNVRDNVTKERDNVTKERDNVTYRDKDIKILRDKDIKNSSTNTHSQTPCARELSEFLSILRSYEFPAINEKAFTVTISHLRNTHSEDELKTALIQILSRYNGQPLTNALRWLQIALTSSLQNLKETKQTDEVKSNDLKEKEELDDTDDPIWDELKKLGE